METIAEELDVDHKGIIMIYLKKLHYFEIFKPELHLYEFGSYEYIQKDKLEDQCSICLESEVQVKLYPCLHAVMCLNCFYKICRSSIQSCEKSNKDVTIQCPICRGKIQKFSKVTCRVFQ